MKENTSDLEESAEADVGEKQSRAVQRLRGPAKTLCIPFDQPELAEGTLCFTGNKALAKTWAYWGRTY